MASAQVVESSVNNNSPSQDSNHPDDLFQSKYVTPGFKTIFLQESSMYLKFDRRILVLLKKQRERPDKFRPERGFAP